MFNTLAFPDMTFLTKLASYKNQLVKTKIWIKDMNFSSYYNHVIYKLRINIERVTERGSVNHIHIVLSNTRGEELDGA